MDLRALNNSILLRSPTRSADGLNAVRTVRSFALVQAWAISLLFSTMIVAQDTTDQETFFESKVRPIFVEHCVSCHGADEQSGGLRLDAQIAVTKGGSSGLVIVPGEPENSPLIKAVHYSDASYQMPPDGKIPDEQIAILEAWIQSGAFWPKTEESDLVNALPPAQRIEQIRESHWAYRPLGTYEPPAVQNEAWPSGAIDRFILNKLEEAGLTPSPRSDKRTLLLRAHFSLTGLAPTYEELESFLHDESDSALERIIDRLLASPHYGERWARHWMDLARYAETTGYQAGSRDTRYPYAYTYRDYLINSFNEDKPYNEFIIDQIAADHLNLSEDQKHRLAGMGFLTVGRKFMGNPNDIIDDQIDVVTRAFLATSVACARCHDHKYDPVPAADYYSLYGVFASSQEPDELPLLGDPTQTPGYSEFLAAVAEKEKEVEHWLDQKRIATEEELRSRTADYLVHFAKSLPPNDAKDVKRIGDRGAMRPPAVGRWHNYLKSDAGRAHPVWGVLTPFRKLSPEDFEAGAKALLDPESSELNGFNTRIVEALRRSEPKSIIEVAKSIGDEAEAVFSQWKELKKGNASLERMEADADEQIRSAFFEIDNPTTLTRDQMIAHLDQAERNQYNVELGKIKTVEMTHSGAPPRGMVMVDKPNLYDPYIFRRGQPGNRGDQVPRRFLQLLSNVDGGQPFKKGSGRLELAEAIANPNNPLTARVIVNRIWQHHFGVGLVSTASDFGSRGESPSHPELLDYLAAEFMADGWSIKRLHKRIMLSSTWQQASQENEAGIAVDPENRLLWRMPRKRLEFEPLRDRLLTVTDSLDRTVGGRSVMIHEDAKRRALYAFLDREDIPGLLAIFDLPSPDASQAIRARTTVPQQALYLINARFVIQQADALANRLASIEDVEDRVRSLFRITLVREPEPDELQMAMDFLAQAEANTKDPSESEPKTEWRFGYGSFHEEDGTVQFTPLPHFTGDSWQGSENMPDQRLSYTSINANGGHPGNDQQHATIIRWIAPATGEISLTGDLRHPSDQGDGVRSRVVSSRSGLLQEWTVTHSDTKTAISSIEVQAGDTIDFIVDCRESPAFDSYQWKFRIKGVKWPKDLAKDAWSVSRDFKDASASLLPSPKIDPWVQLCQVLLLSNEFAFVD
jgi:cytochrome c553